MVSSTRPRRSPTTRKIDIRVNALERQEEALIDCGVDPAHVIRAALRRAVKNWGLGSEFVPTSEEQRTRITEWRARTSLVRILCKRTDTLVGYLYQWNNGELQPAWLNNATAEVRYEPLIDAGCPA